MSQDLAPPPPGPVKSKPRRRLVPWLSDEPDKRSVQIGVAGTVLIHLLLLLFVPFSPKKVAVKGYHPHVSRNFNIQFVPNQPKAPPPKPRMKYVEANPNANQNTPNHTDNVSDRNQRVAQEKPTPNGKNDMPTTEGRKNLRPIQIVDGNLAKPEENLPTPAPTPPKPAAAAVQRRAQNPLAGIDKTQGTDVNGFATNVGKKIENQTATLQSVVGSNEGPLISNFSAGAPMIDPKHPQPRHMLEQHVRPAVFADNKYGTSNIGLQALDARWSNYGVYMRRLTETVQIEWDRILDEGAITPASGNTVSVSFILNSKGEITKITGVDASAGTSDEAKQACVSGITNRAPYGLWTDDMIAVLGTEQPITFTFYYQ